MVATGENDERETGGSASSGSVESVLFVSRRHPIEGRGWLLLLEESRAPVDCQVKAVLIFRCLALHGMSKVANVIVPCWRYRLPPWLCPICASSCARHDHIGNTRLIPSYARK